MRWFGGACVGLAALTPSVASAGFYSGDQLYEVCTAEHGDRGYVDRTYECIAYVTGAVDAFNATREAARQKSCIPGDVTIKRLRDVTVDYLRARPDERDQSAAKAVFAATRKEWPCGKAASGKPVPVKRGAAKPSATKRGRVRS
jgi:hypothetical protein